MRTLSGILLFLIFLSSCGASQALRITAPRYEIAADERFIEIELGADLEIPGVIRALMTVLGISGVLRLELVIDLETGEVCGQLIVLGAALDAFAQCSQPIQQSTQR